MDKERIDEALELLWVLNEEAITDLNRFRLSSEDDEVDALINVLKTEGSRVLFRVIPFNLPTRAAQRLRH